MTRSTAAEPVRSPASPPRWWSLAPQELATALASSPDGLADGEAARRLADVGPNAVRAPALVTRGGVLLAQVRSPLVLLLVVAAVLSLATREWVDAVIVLLVLGATVAVGASREFGAQRAADALRRRLALQATVLRAGRPARIPVDAIVPGDVVLLSAGVLVPADGVLLDAQDFHVAEAALTGESLPVRKAVGAVPADAPLGRRTNAVFQGTNVRSGTARVLVAATGRRTAFGAIAQRLAEPRGQTAYDRGMREFGMVLLRAMVVLVLVVVVVNVLLDRPPIATLLFAVALAVGLSPELLPAVLTVNLARGASAMAARGVLVKRLHAIENLGAMDVLCTDKTGTLTEGVVRLEAAVDAAGVASARVHTLAAWNALLQTGFANPLDDAIRGASGDVVPPEKLGEVPWDFVRRRMSVAVADGDGALLIAKGAVEDVLEACTSRADGAPLDEAGRAALVAAADARRAEGVRVLAVAVRPQPRRGTWTREDEQSLTFAGFLHFLDRVKADARHAVAGLAGQGVRVVMVTGDAALVAQHVAAAVGLRQERVLDGEALDAMSDEALRRAVDETDLFAALDPPQKVRVIEALRASGHVVGFLGDGINDAPAMQAADAGLSVEGAVDVAREAADFVLLERDLDAIRTGIAEGRRTFANTEKYIHTTTSANLGNMASVAAASLVLPFLPMLPGQILLNNFLSDVPAVGIADDAVDPELVERPRRWDARAALRFMVWFGLLSSVFDLVTFATLARLAAGGAATFRTGWFLESLLTELAVALVVRTRRRAWRSRPGAVLLWSTAATAIAAVAVPYVPGTSLLGFVPLPPAVLGAVVAITVAYTASAEVLKGWFFRRVAGRHSGGE